MSPWCHDSVTMLQQGSHSSMTLMSSSSLLRLKPSALSPVQLHRCMFVMRKSGSDAVMGVQVVGTGQALPMPFQSHGEQPTMAPSPLAQQVPLQPAPPLSLQPDGGQPSPLAQQMPLQLPTLPSSLQFHQQPLQLRSQPLEQLSATARAEQQSATARAEQQSATSGAEQPSSTAGAKLPSTTAEATQPSAIAGAGQLSATAGAEQWPQHALAQHTLQQCSQQPLLEPLDKLPTESPDAPLTQCQELSTQLDVHACGCAATGDHCTGVSAEGRPSRAAADEAMVVEESLSDLLHCKQACGLNVAAAAAAADRVPDTVPDKVPVTSTYSLLEPRGECLHQQEPDQHGQHGQHGQAAGDTLGLRDQLDEQHAQQGEQVLHDGQYGQHGQQGQHAGHTHGQQHEQHANCSHGQHGQHEQHGQHGQHEQHAGHTYGQHGSVIPSQGADEAELLPVGITTYTEVCPGTQQSTLQCMACYLMLVFL